MVATTGPPPTGCSFRGTKRVDEAGRRSGSYGPCRLSSLTAQTRLRVLEKGLYYEALGLQLPPEKVVRVPGESVPTEPEDMGQEPYRALGTINIIQKGSGFLGHNPGDSLD